MGGLPSAIVLPQQWSGAAYRARARLPMSPARGLRRADPAANSARGPADGLDEGPSRAGLLQPAACFFAQLDLLHLPRTRHGQFLDEDDVAGDLVACDLAAAVLDDLGCGEFVSWLHAEERDGHFAEARVGKAHHRHGSDGWMACKVGLDFQRVDIFPADLEHIFVAPHEAQVPIGSHEAHVAGVKPALRVDRLGGFLGLAIVGLHDHVAPHEDFPGRSWRLFVACGGLDNLDLIAGRGIARSLRALLLAGIERAQCYTSPKLAHAIARQEAAEHLARLPGNWDRA